MRIIDVNSKVTTFPIGHMGENDATQVRFDYVELFQDDFGPGVCELLFQRPGEEEPYAVPVKMDGDRVIWTVSDTDTDIPGRTGKAVLHYYVGEALAKSHVWMVTVLPSLGAKRENPPEKFEDWVNEVLQAGSDVKTAVADAERYSESAARSEKIALAAKVSVDDARDEVEAIRDEVVNFGSAGAGKVVAGQMFDVGGIIKIAEEKAEVFNATDANIATGYASHAEGENTWALGWYSHAEGRGTIANGYASHVAGEYNLPDWDANDPQNRGKYAHIVGNGDYYNRSNAHTLDWFGNAWYAGSVEASFLVLVSPDGTRFKITVGNDGMLSAEAIIN